MNRFYLAECSNIHRGVHYLSEQPPRHTKHPQEGQRLLNAAGFARDHFRARRYRGNQPGECRAYGRRNVGQAMKS